MEAHDLINKLAGLAKQVNDTLQDPFFESWALQQQRKVDAKLAARGDTRIHSVFLGHHLQHARPLQARRDFVHLDESFLLSPPQTVPPGSVFLLLNNDVAKHLPQYIDFYNRHPEALFVIWDWDSQHWLYMSSVLAMHADFYISASSENAHLLSQFNPYTIGPVFAAAHQWTRKFLLEHLEIFLAPRVNEPLGMHVYYENYPRRNRAIATVSPTFPSVGFGTNDFKNRSELDNFQEWARHKTHWIVPVLAGVPIRVYNALVTGGIPILPAFYRNLPEIGILGDVPVYYQVSDLVQPRLVNEAAVARFDAAGEGGLLQRITQAIEQHHVDRRCEHIFDALETCMTQIARGDKSHGQGYLGLRA